MTSAGFFKSNLFSGCIKGFSLIFLFSTILGACSLLGIGGSGDTPDYVILSPTFPANAGVATAFSGTFIIANTGAGTGVNPVSWAVYRSDNAALEASDTQLGTGTIAALAPGGLSNVIAFNGTWPSTAKDYFIIIELTGIDDASVANNKAASSAITISPLPVVDYAATNTAFPSIGSPGTTLDGSFKIQNQGDAAGAHTVSWNVYVSPDNSLEAGADPLVDNGTQPALDSGQYSPIINFTGNWPAAVGTYYMFIVIYASDDGNAANDETISAALAVSQPPGVDYVITTPVFPTDGVINDAYNGSFKIQNIGAQGGVQTLGWTVYRSDDPVYDTGDVPIQSGVTPALTAGSISPQIDFAGNWTTTPNVYNLIVKITAGDDTDGTNDELVSGDISVVEIADYEVSSPTLPVSGTLSGPLEGNFRITNNGTLDGSQPVDWEVYISSNSTYEAGDTLAASGTLLTPVGSTLSSAPIFFTSTWPAAAMNYYVIIIISAADEGDISNNEYTSAAIGVINAGRLVIVGESGMIMYTDDGGTSWLSASIVPLTTQTFNDVATNGAGMWVVVGNSNKLYYSIDDAETWQPATITGTPGNLTGVAFGAGNWVATGPIVTGPTTGVYSADGINWALKGTYTGNYNTQDVTYDEANGRWIAVNLGNSRVLYSAAYDVDYTSSGSLPANRNVSYGNGRVMAVGGSTGISFLTTGTTWTAATTYPTSYGSGANYYGSAFGNNVWVMVGFVGGGYPPAPIIATSTNGGVDWNDASNMGDTAARTTSVVFDSVSGRFIAGCLDGTIKYSINGGDSWTDVTTNTGLDIWAIAAGPNL